MLIKRNSKNKKTVDFGRNLDKISVLVYDDIKSTSDGGVMMTSKEILAAALKETGKTQADAAKSVGWSPQQLSSRLVRNSLRADELLKLLDGIGIDFNIVSRETGKTVRVNISGRGRRVRAMVDRISYDTAASEAISNNFYADGKNEYTDGKALELYIDKKGRYFFAEYSNWEGSKDRITPVSSRDAAAFIEKYGTDLNKGPKKE